MFTKYEIKTYPDNPRKNSKNNNYINNEKDTEQITKTTFQPKCIFTKQNNNISFYQSSSKNSFKNSKNKDKKSTANITPIMKTKKNIYTINTTQEKTEENAIQNFSYNYSGILDNTKKRKNRTIKNNINNININITPNNNTFNFNNNNNSEYIDNNNSKPKRLNLKEHLSQRNTKKRITKSYKKQYNVQKRDDFNVLSYRQPEEDSDINALGIIPNKKNKIIKIYKKQEVDEIFLPSKRTHSPTITNKRTEKVEKYQTHTLKYQNFFGSFNCNNPKKIKKSISKRKINQLNDFNIDKLIEIGDKYVNMQKPVLPLGKIMNNNILFFKNKIKKNKFQIPINTYNNCFNFSKYSKRSFNTYIDDDKENIPNLINDKNRVTKKIISKNNLRNNSKKNIKDNDFDENESQKKSEDNTVRKNLQFKNENEIQNLKNNDYLNNSGTNVTVIIKKRNLKNNSRFLRKQNSFDKNMKNNDFEEIIPKRKFQKITYNLSLNNNTNNNKNSNYILLKENKKNEKLLTYDISNYRSSRNNKKKIEQNNNRQILIDININKRNNKYINNGINKNKSKNYYGYDDRHNLEETINNHAYYESLYYKKA